VNSTNFQTRNLSEPVIFCVAQRIWYLALIFYIIMCVWIFVQNFLKLINTVFEISKQTSYLFPAFTNIIIIIMPRCTALLRSSVMPWWLRATREFSPVPLTWLERGRIRCKRSDPENLQMFAQARRILYQRLWSCHSHFARKRPQPQVYIFSKALYKCSS
jgi:hypothetical protein